MRYIKVYDDYVYVDPQYQYIRYKLDKANTILRINVITNDCKLLDLDTNTFRETCLDKNTLLADFEKSDMVKKPGNFWRVATDKEIEQFKITDATNKYNL